MGIDYGDNYWDGIGINCCCGSFECRKPSGETTYWTQESSERAKACEEAEEQVASRMVQEALLCRKRLELVRKGKSVEEAILLLPTKRGSRKRAKARPFHPEDRCSSPLTMPIIETLDWRIRMLCRWGYSDFNVFCISSHVAAVTCCC